MSTLHSPYGAKNDAQPQAHAHLHLTSAALPFFHPTHARGTLGQRDGAGGDINVLWRSRASRKRLYTSKPVSVSHDRHAAPTTMSGEELKREGQNEVHRRFAELRVHHKGHQGRHMLGVRFRFVADVSFWVALIFVLGSTAWVINGFLLFMPLVSSAKNHNTAAAAWAFVGAIFFEIGSYLMLVESLNTGHNKLFGPSIESLLEGNQHGDKRVGLSEGEKFYWIGIRSWRDLGYLASSIQMAAATIFWISTLTGLPGVIPGFPGSSNTTITDVFFWSPQVIGGLGFIISSTLLMLEEQSTWWGLAVSSIGWHVAAWNLIGSIGFTLCGAFGYGSVSITWLNYESVLATFWGSWAFMIGSLLQLGETLMRE